MEGNKEPVRNGYSPPASIRLESIMLQNFPIMLFEISLIFCLLWFFLCFLGMDYADISCF